MVEEVKTAFKERLETRTWLDKTTKDRSKEKVDAITKMVAYPDQIHNDTYLNDLYKDVSVMISAGVLVCMGTCGCHVRFCPSFNLSLPPPLARLYQGAVEKNATKNASDLPRLFSPLHWRDPTLTSSSQKAPRSDTFSVDADALNLLDTP